MSRLFSQPNPTNEQKVAQEGALREKKFILMELARAWKAVDDQNTLIVWTCANMFNKLLERWSFA